MNWHRLVYDLPFAVLCIRTTMALHEIEAIQHDKIFLREDARDRCRLSAVFPCYNHDFISFFEFHPALSILIIGRMQYGRSACRKRVVAFTVLERAGFIRSQARDATFWYPRST